MPRIHAVGRFAFSVRCRPVRRSSRPRVALSCRAACCRGRGRACVRRVRARGARRSGSGDDPAGARVPHDVSPCCAEVISAPRGRRGPVPPSGRGGTDSAAASACVRSRRRAPKRSATVPVGRRSVTRPRRAAGRRARRSPGGANGGRDRPPATPRAAAPGAPTSTIEPERSTLACPRPACDRPATSASPAAPPGGAS